jgi:hypothetical protein
LALPPPQFSQAPGDLLREIGVMQTHRTHPGVAQILVPQHRAGQIGARADSAYPRATGGLSTSPSRHHLLTAIVVRGGEGRRVAERFMRVLESATQATTLSLAR